MAPAFTTVTRLSRKAERQQFIIDLRTAVLPLHLARSVELTERADNAYLNLIGARLSAQVWFFHRKREGVPLGSWYDAATPLKGLVAGAWCDVNQFHRRKATSFPPTLDELIGCLVAGLSAARDGSAFIEVSCEPEKEDA